MEDEFAPNSHRSRDRKPRTEIQEVAPSKEIRQIAKGRVRIRKKPLHKKVMEAFRPEDNVGFVEHMLLDILVPSIKDALYDAGTGALGNILGTGGAPRRRGGGRDRGYTSYSSMSRSRPRERRDRDDDRRSPSRGNSSDFDPREAILETRVEAEDILDTLTELIDVYDVATVRDLMGMLGVAHKTTDEDWGWTNLRSARVHRVGGAGYLLDLPRAEYLG